MNSKYTALYRIWHWLMAFSVIGLLFTVLLRKTFLSYKTNSLIIQDKLASLDVNIPIESAVDIAKAIRAPMWEWHYVFGFFLVASILIRIYMLITKQGVMPLIALIRAPKEEKLKYGVYLFLCMFIAIMTISGIFLYFYKELGFTKEDIHLVKELHENLTFGVLFFIALHFIGVLKHELTTKDGIVSKMIHGN